MSETKYKKFADAKPFDDYEDGEANCNDCGSNDIDIENHQCDDCGSPDIDRSTVLETKTCAICGDEFEAYTSSAMYSENAKRFICEPCFDEHVEPAPETE